MKLFRALSAFLIILATAICTSRDGLAKLTEPDVVYFGTLTGGKAGDSVTLKLDSDGTILKTAVVTGTSFVLRVPMDSVEPRSAGAARNGDKASFYLGNKVIHTVVIPERGSLVTLSLSATTPTLEEWKKLHPNDDGSGDKNRNGISDLQDYLNGKDPEFLWNALTVSTLADNAIATDTTLNVAGTVNDNGSGIGVKGVTVNGQAATITNSSFSIAIPLLDGPNLITTTASDNFENKTIDTRTITLNRSAPALTIVLPADNSVTGKTFTEVSGSVDDATSTVTAVVNDESATSASMNGTNFSVTLNLRSGLNSIEITTTNVDGSSSNAKRTVTSDTHMPTLAITDPVRDISTTRSSISIRGIVTDVVTSAVVNISVDEQNYIPTVADDGSFSQSIPLGTDKAYAVMVTATDQAGNKSTVQRNIIKTSGELISDGSVTMLKDVLEAFRYVYGKVTLTETEKLKLDCAPLGADGKPNPNGVVDTADVIMLLRKIVGLVNW